MVLVIGYGKGSTDVLVIEGLLCLLDSSIYETYRSWFGKTHNGHIPICMDRSNVQVEYFRVSEIPFA